MIILVYLLDKSIISNLDKLSEVSLSFLHLLKENSKPSKTTLYEIFKSKIVKRNFIAHKSEIDEYENLEIKKPSYYFAIDSNDFFPIVQTMGKIPRKELWEMFKIDFKNAEETNPNFLYFSKIKILTRELSQNDDLNTRSEGAYKKVISDSYFTSSHISESIKNKYYL